MGALSCKEEPNEAPSVTINAPGPDAIVTVGDSLSVSISVSDDVEVSALNLSLLNEEQQPIVTENISINEQQKEVLIAFVIDDLTIPSGDYVLLATVYDAELSSKASIPLKMKEAKRKLLNYVLWSGTQVSTLNNEFNHLSSTGIDETIQNIQIKHSERGYLLHTEGQKLQYRDVITNEKIWSSSEISSQKVITASAYHYDRFFTYVFDEAGSVYKVDNLGRIVIEKAKWLHPFMYTNERINEVLSFGDESLRFLNKNTLEVNSISTPIPSPQLVFSNEFGDVFIYSNFEGRAELFSSQEAPFRSFDKANVLLDALGPVSKAVAAGTDQFLLDNGIIWSVRGSTVERVAGLNSGARDFVIDRSSGELIVLYSDVIVRYTSSGPVELGRNSDGYHGLALLYNF